MEKNSHVVSQIQIIAIIYRMMRLQGLIISMFASRMTVVSSGDDQQWLHSKQRRLWVLHKGGKHDHSHRRLLWYFRCHWWFGRYNFSVKPPQNYLNRSSFFSIVLTWGFLLYMRFHAHLIRITLVTRLAWIIYVNCAQITYSHSHNQAVWG